MHSILIVDDEPNYLIVLSELLKDEGFEVFTAPGGAEGLEIIRNTDLDLVLTDMQMPGMDGLEFLQATKTIYPELPVIMITAYAEVEKAVMAMQAGAFNYLAKPFSNDELLVNISKAIEHYSVIRENVQLRREMRSRVGFGEMVGKNPRMLVVYDMIEKVSPTSASVLISGESGTGKELVAKAIHLNSPRKDNSFIAVNCAALTGNMLESELFGHEKGAFDGANIMRKGRFEAADGGTIYLDEICQVPLQLQTKLLKLMQDQSFERLGGATTLKVNVRIISSSAKDLKEEVAKGNFLEDLYYRLNVIHMALPPLRERMDDLPAIADYFVKKAAENLNKEKLKLSTTALRLLLTLPWDGNIRELENTIERAAILCDNNRIEPEDVQPEDTGDATQSSWSNEIDLRQMIPDSVGLNDVLYSIEEKMLLQALEDTDYVQARAAEKLGITKSLLQYKMKKYRIKKK